MDGCQVSIGILTSGTHECGVGVERTRYSHARRNGLLLGQTCPFSGRDRV